jgi:hypothetical protein
MNMCLEKVNDRHFMNPGVFSYAMIPRCCPNSRVLFFVVTSIVYGFNPRYEFKNGKRVALKELGPRFTLKLRWLQKGTFNTKHGEYEWIHRRGEMDTSRRRFHL